MYNILAPFRKPWSLTVINFPLWGGQAGTSTTWTLIDFFFPGHCFRDEKQKAPRENQPMDVHLFSFFFYFFFNFFYFYFFSIYFQLSIKPSLSQLGSSSVCHRWKTPMKSDFEKIEFNFSHIKEVQKRHSRIVWWLCGLSKDSSFSLSAPLILA